MIYKKHYFPFLLSALFLIMCCAMPKKHIKDRLGVEDFNVFFFDTSVYDYIYFPTYSPRTRHWYKDSLVITESIQATLEDGPFISPPDTLWFTFINLKTREYYRYKNFSDTAILMESFIGPAKGSADGSWSFFRNKPNYSLDTAITYQKDTVIEGKVFKRIAILAKDSLSNPKTGFVSGTAFLDCEKQNRFLQFNEEFGRTFGCAIVRVDFFPFKHGGLSARIDHISDTFSLQEKKVFAAWEKYAREHPVTKW